MKIKEDYVNATEGYGYGDSMIDLADTIFDPESPTLIGDIFQASQKEYGRCISKVYVDFKDKTRPPIQVGWVFQKRVKYEDSKDTYLREVWVTLYDEHYEKPIRKYHDFK